MAWLMLVFLLAIPVYSVFSTGVSLIYIALPIFAFTTLGWFVWRVFGRVYLRATRIAHIRERRLLKEASMR